jgi:hypothetical protein
VGDDELGPHDGDLGFLLRHVGLQAPELGAEEGLGPVHADRGLAEGPADVGVAAAGGVLSVALAGGARRLIRIGGAATSVNRE